ncbi:hypothetical protein Pmani_004248 [Petrolisthes manimaculis]|uniref:PiggyBac transposable element-derived protein domain-containing protein n=1 Tax=Petrolisthes manimaculis TaxID=1843537 RepID=A0AAE1QH43_9EUCA|nr:hypothetical protein Pmani_004248 [Petrolisthes manimaculis]
MPSQTSSPTTLPSQTSSPTTLPSQTSPPTQDTSGPTATPSSSADHTQCLFQLSPGQCRPSDKTVWSRTPLARRSTVTQPALPYTQGLTAKSGDAESATDFFKLLVDEDKVQDIVTHTNTRIDVLAPKYTDKHKGPVSHTCPEEIWALMGILVQSGPKQDNRKTTREMFDVRHGPPLDRAEMSEARFYFLLRALWFDEQATREERRSTDKLAPFRDMWEKFVKNCKESYIPGSDITVDEQLLGFRRRCPFRFYLAKKYGLKIIIACDAKEYYMLNGDVDLGKHRTERVAPGKVAEHITMKLVEPYLDCGRNITTDNWFTSMSFATELYKKKTTRRNTTTKRICSSSNAQPQD